MRRPRSDSKLEALTADQKQLLCEWLFTPALTLRVIKRKLRDEFNLETSPQALSRFFQNYCAAELLRRRQEAVSLTSRMARQVKRLPGKWDHPTIDALKQACYEMAISPASKPSELRGLFTLVLKARDQDLHERKIRILETASPKPRLNPAEKQRPARENSHLQPK